MYFTFILICQKKSNPINVVKSITEYIEKLSYLLCKYNKYNNIIIDLNLGKTATLFTYCFIIYLITFHYRIFP